jgi:hypothetical protein
MRRTPTPGRLELFVRIGVGVEQMGDHELPCRRLALPGFPLLNRYSQLAMASSYRRSPVRLCHRLVIPAFVRSRPTRIAGLVGPRWQFVQDRLARLFRARAGDLLPVEAGDEIAEGGVDDRVAVVRLDAGRRTARSTREIGPGWSAGRPRQSI